MIYFMCHPICGWIAGASTLRRFGGDESRCVKDGREALTFR